MADQEIVLYDDDGDVCTPHMIGIDHRMMMAAIIKNYREWNTVFKQHEGEMEAIYDECFEVSEELATEMWGEDKDGAVGDKDDIETTWKYL